MISTEDLKEVIRRLTGEQQLSEEDMEQLIKNVCYLCVLTIVPADLGLFQWFSHPTHINPVPFATESARAKKTESAIMKI